MGGAFLLALAGTLRAGRFKPLRLSLICFAIFGVLSVASSAFSFWPPLSAVKGMLYLAILGFAYFATGLCEPWKFLRSIYFSYIGIVVVGIVVGLFAGNSFPLFDADDYSGRTRLSMFSTSPGTQGEVAAVMFLVGRTLPARPSWFWQMFLLLINIASGGKTSTFALFAILAFSMIFRRRTIRSWLRISTAAGITAVLIVAIALVSSSVGSSLLEKVLAENTQRGLESVYGDQVTTDASDLDGRADLWKATVSVFPQCILLGFGFDGARDVLLRAVYWEAGNSHNGFLEVVLAAGMPGALFLLIGWFLCIRSCFRRANFMSVHSCIALTSVTGLILTFPSYLSILFFVTSDDSGSDVKYRFPKPFLPSFSAPLIKFKTHSIGEAHH
jgi:O-antigen ligase